MAVLEASIFGNSPAFAGLKLRLLTELDASLADSGAFTKLSTVPLSRVLCFANNCKMRWSAIPVT